MTPLTVTAVTRASCAMKVAWEPNDAGPPAGPATSMPGIKLEAPQPGPEPRGPDPLAALSNSVAPESNIGPGLCRYVTGPGRWQIRPRVGLKKPPALARQISVAGRAIQARAHIQRSGGNGRAGRQEFTIVHRSHAAGAAATGRQRPRGCKVASEVDGDSGDRQPPEQRKAMVMVGSDC